MTGSFLCALFNTEGGEKQMYILKTNQGSVLSPKANNTNLFLIKFEVQTWGKGAVKDKDVK